MRHYSHGTTQPTIYLASMYARFQVAARWLLVAITFSVTSFAFLILLMGPLQWPDRSVVAALSAASIDPRLTIEAVHRVDLLLAILTWVVPPTCAAGFAARISQGRALRLALSISVLLFAALCFFLGRRDRSAAMETSAVIAAVIALSAFILPFFRLTFSRYRTTANLIAVLLLFGPSLLAFSRRTGAAPQPKQLWSTTLQREQWQSMNTGSEYGATRQLIFAGDRVIAVFDAGFASSQPPKDKWPVSTYRLISLDVKTGAKRNEITFPGRWGTMPYIYSTQSGLIDVQSDPPRTLNPDLSSANVPSRSASTNRVVSQKQPECGAACDPPTYVLAKNTLVQLQPNRFRVIDDKGRVLSGGKLVEWGSFAGASVDGRRFAIDSSYTEGDPDFVVYEYFTIYDTASGNAVATVHIQDLPARQSWSAFSPDGHYFVSGNPNKLTMYELPHS